MSGTWISRAELLALPGWNDARIRRKKPRSRPTAEKGRNGKLVREYLLESLPAEDRKNWELRRSPATALTLKTPAAPAPRILTPKQQAQADAQYKLIAAMIDASQGREVRTADGRLLENHSQAAAWLAQGNAAVYRKVWRLWKKWKAQGFAGLARPASKFQGKSRFFDSLGDAATFVQNKYLNERIQNHRLVYEALEREWPKLGIAGDAPAYSTVNAYLNRLPKPLQTLAHKGPRAFHGKHSPYIQRDTAAIRPMDWLVLDHRMLDVDCRNVLFAELKPGAMYRPQVTAIVDWGSLAWVGFCVSPQPSWRTIGSALRLTLLNYGFPKNLYWDNGEDFKKTQRVLEGEEFGGALQIFLKERGIGFEVTRALPYNARAKMIEAMFSGMSKRFDPLFGDAYQGSSTARRSEYNDRAQKRHAKYLAGKEPSSPLPTDVEVIAALIQWFDKENNRRRKSLAGRTPMEVLEEACPPARRQPVDRRVLDLLFSERDPRKVLRGGCVQLDNRRYEPAEVFLGALHVREGQSVLILRDPYMLEEATAVDPETGEFIAELRLQEFVAQCPGGHVTRDQISAAMRRQRGLRRMYSEYLGFLSAVGSAQGWRSERQVLAEESGLCSTGTDGRMLSAVPGARQMRQLPPARVFDDLMTEQAKFDSPFVSDKMEALKAVMRETETPNEDGDLQVEK